jgi:hypothetical protein
MRKSRLNLLALFTLAIGAHVLSGQAAGATGGSDTCQTGSGDTCSSEIDVCCVINGNCQSGADMCRWLWCQDNPDHPVCQ